MKIASSEGGGLGLSLSHDCLPCRPTRRLTRTYVTREKKKGYGMFLCLSFRLVVALLDPTPYTPESLPVKDFAPNVLHFHLSLTFLLPPF